VKWSPPFGRGLMPGECARTPPAIWPPNELRNTRWSAWDHRKRCHATRKWG
jgi:hypothetical protein